jgi:hypothetical protein
MQQCLIVQVNKEDYDSLFELTRGPLEKLGIEGNGLVLVAYRLGAEDCVSFVIAIANGLGRRGLKVPKRRFLERPLAYVRRLIDENQPAEQPPSAPSNLQVQ